MQFLPLLGKSLKDDDVMEVLEHYDIDVIYSFDRTHENMEDIYWAAAKNVGFQLRFDENQVLDVIFLYMTSREGFAAIDRSTVDVPIFETFDEALNACQSKRIPYKASAGKGGAETDKWWIKLIFDDHTVHYQYKDSHLVMTTIAVEKKDA